MVTAEKTTSMVMTDVGEMSPQEFPLPDVSDEGALLEVEMTSVCGTDIGIFSGKSKIHAIPLIFGHEVVGRVIDGNEDTLAGLGIAIGDRVVPEPYIPCHQCTYCHGGNYHMCEHRRCYGVTISSSSTPHLWGGYGEYMYLDPKSKVHQIGEDIPPEAACMATVVGNAWRWVITKGSVDPDDSVVIVGPGAQGLATTLVAEKAGAHPIVLTGLESDRTRLDIGEELGASHTVLVDQGDPVEKIHAIVGDEGADVVIITAPATQAIQLGFDLIAPLGTIVIPAVVGESTELQTDQIMRNEITVLGGRGQANSVEPALQLVERHPNAVAKLISHRFPMAQAQTALEKQFGPNGRDQEIVHAALEPERIGE